MVLLNLHVLRSFSELISPAAAAGVSNVSLWDRWQI